MRTSSRENVISDTASSFFSWAWNGTNCTIRESHVR